MQQENFTKVFDIASSGYKNWGFAAFGLIFIVAGAAMVFGPRILRNQGATLFAFKSKYQKVFAYFFLVFSIFWTSTAFLSTYTSFHRHRKLAESNTCKNIEGPVENFIPMPWEGHAEESFSVSGVKFRYSDYIVSDGFNNTSSHGGPIKGDSYVRICYDPRSNVILRLEIKDYSGPIKDYSKTESPLTLSKDPPPANFKPMFPQSIPWYFNLFVLFFVVDFIGIWKLYKPYIRTFFKIGIVNITPTKIPERIFSSEQSTLKNVVCTWDEREQAIWMRPRGLNLFQVQLVVAKVKVDTIGKLSESCEVRFSSGFPISLAACLFTAYQFFSLVMPKNSQIAPVQFVGIFFVMAVVGGLFNLKMFKNRLSKLVESSLEDLKENGGST